MLSRKEFIAGLDTIVARYLGQHTPLNSKQKDELIASVDLDGNGRIDLAEFLALMGEEAPANASTNPPASPKVGLVFTATHAQRVLIDDATVTHRAGGARCPLLLHIRVPPRRIVPQTVIALHC